MTDERIVVRRHSLAVRVTHWVNAVCLLFLLMSGLQIFNAHPALYWGQQSTFDKPILALEGTENDESGAVGTTRIFGYALDTTGFLGAGTSSSRGCSS